jgi:hypothetical protein
MTQGFEVVTPNVDINSSPEAGGLAMQILYSEGNGMAKRCGAEQKKVFTTQT